MRYPAEVLPTHAAERVAILLVNLGTPDAPTPSAVRRYLAEFLSDPRVIEIPAWIWQPILRLGILPLRAGKVAHKYAQIWMPEGSPLRVYTERQAEGLRQALAAHGYQVQVDYAMRYGKPGLGAALELLKRRGAGRILLLPLYPQYASSTTGTGFDAAYAALAKMRRQPELRTVADYYDHPAYIGALAARVQDFWAVHGRPDFAAGARLVLSFHGLPRRTIDLGDPYHEHCQATGSALMRALGLSEIECRITFQSRFGRAEWLQPYTLQTLTEFGAAGVPRVDVFCPGFPADCLETIEEIGMQCRAAYLQAGGGVFHRIDCLNDAPVWLEALALIAAEHLQGWPVAAPALPDGESPAPIH